mmetsp:Transcript_71694/g.168827  ORF Transcript_71694/g.168827 Transcript_71694/m.168827 type:complete len:85 (-) Transcript_71694:58-312(-)
MREHTDLAVLCRAPDALPTIEACVGLRLALGVRLGAIQGPAPTARELRRGCYTADAARLYRLSLDDDQDDIGGFFSHCEDPSDA